MKRRRLRGWITFTSCVLALVFGLHARAGSTNRGVWCWKNPSPYGLNFIIGSNDLQNAAVAEFKLWGISHVYGSYGDQLKTVPGQAALANWNALLHSNGIESQLLISDTSWGSGDNNILVLMINFNKAQPPASQVKAVHLDIEPWGLASWPTDNKYNDLVNLAAVYQLVRTELDTNGLTAVPVYADLADWLDNLSSINWPSSSVRDQWYSDILQTLAGITLMAYQQPTLTRIQNVVSWEMTNHPGVVRVGIDAGVGETWSDLNAFATVAGQVESIYTDSAGVDIYDFITVEKEAPAVLAVGAAPASGPNGFHLMLRGPVGSNYVVRTSTNLVDWQTITNFSSTSWLTYITDPEATNYPCRFYKLEP
jgi:hypothetical protein